jgi:hypothetical protein
LLKEAAMPVRSASLIVFAAQCGLPHANQKTSSGRARSPRTGAAGQGHSILVRVPLRGERRFLRGAPGGRRAGGRRSIRALGHPKTTRLPDPEAPDHDGCAIDLRATMRAPSHKKRPTTTAARLFRAPGSGRCPTFGPAWSSATTSRPRRPRRRRTARARPAAAEVHARSRADIWKELGNTPEVHHARSCQRAAENVECQRPGLASLEG